MYNKIISLLVLVLILSGCSANYKYYSKVIEKISHKYGFSRVEMEWDDLSATFVLEDTSNDDLSMEKMKSYSFTINEYLINKYSKIDSLEKKHYIFSGVGGFEIAHFTIDKHQNLVNEEEF